MPGSRAETPADGPVAVAVDDYLWFVDLAFEKMARILEDLGDEMSNRRPDFRGANSPYGIFAHCLAVLEYWGGGAVAGRAVRRDGDGGFSARGDVEGLVRRAAQARRRLREDLVDLDAASPPEGRQGAPADQLPSARSKGGALVHILEELFVHLGHMEITRDALVAGGRSPRR